MYPFVETLYSKYAAELTTPLALSTNDREAAADLVHEVFVLAMLNEGALCKHPDPRGWLFRMGYNLARNRWRPLLRRRHKIEREYCVLPARAWEDTMHLRESLSRLSRGQRDAVVLHYYFGFNVKEIAAVLGCAEGTVMAQLYRGREALRNLLDIGEVT